MARAKKEEAPKAGCPEWLATYGDLITLLMCFFVLLFAMSTIDAKKFQAMVSGLSGNPAPVIVGGGSGIDEMFGSGIMEMPAVNLDLPIEIAAKTAEEAQKELQQMASDFKTYLAENQLQEKIEVKIAEDSVTLVFKEGILFDLGRAVLKEEAMAALDVVANEIHKYPENDIEISGHTDNLPINTVQYPSNWQLSYARAFSVAEYFIDQKGVVPVRIIAVGRGEYLPIATNNTPEGRAQNRRVEIKFKSKYYSDSAK